MSTPTFGANPRPETRIWLVGGPVFLERVMEGVALAIVESSRHAMNRDARNVIGLEYF
jgi:hypothetical protein